MNNGKDMRKKGFSAIFKALLVATSAFALYANVFSLWPPIVIRGVFWGFVAMAVFLGTAESAVKGWKLCLDTIFALSAGLCTALLLFRWEDFSWGIHDPTFLESAAGAIMILLVLEATRRVIGWTLAGMTVIFLLYGLFGNHAPGFLEINGYSFPRLISFLFWDSHGLYGLPMQIAASYVALFVIFGTLLLKCGGERWFMDMSCAAFGRTRGGPALIAVVSSAFFGMISGSPVANVVTTGSFTIPLMKKIGFEKRAAGAIEAVASTAGMFTPPIMGAGAFIMAEYVEVPYVAVAMAAALPAFLFYVSLMATVYLRACKSGIPALGGERVPKMFSTFRDYGHLTPPLFILVGMVLGGWSLMWAAFWSIVSLLALATLRRRTRLSPADILDALGDATRKIIPVAVACAAAGLIYGVISATGLGFKISSSLLSLAGGSKILVLAYSMASGILLGFAMPPTAAYIILAVLIVPSLTAVGLQPLAAHMFLFMFCCVGPITPPVALAAYAASGIAGSDPNRTGFAAFRIGLAAYVIPFLFAYSPELLLLGGFLSILAAGSAAMAGLLLLVAAVEGYGSGVLNWRGRTLALCMALALFLALSFW
jgi:TRAP transporter 4TM/12TM fusion protein